MKNGNVFRMLAIAFILPVLLVVLIGTPALAAPVITVSPTSGAVGTVVEITGTNFESYIGDDIFIYFDSEEIGVVVPDTGSFSFNFTVPADADAKVHWVRAKTEGGAEFKSLFTVLEAEIELAPRSGVIGSSVTVVGRGFYADKMVTFYLDNRTKGKLGTVMAGPDGEFSYSFTVPGCIAGEHMIFAENVEDSSAEAEFKVLPMATLSPASGAMGSILTISGSGFGNRNAVAIFFATTIVTYAKTNAYGSFEVAFNVPNMAPGSYEVTAEDDDGNTDKVEFTITTGASLNRTTGNIGTELAVTGTGFTAGGTVTIKYDDTEIGAFRAGGNGDFKATFTVPVSKYGSHVITVGDGVNARQMTFVVESEAPPVPVTLLPGDGDEAKAAAGFDWEDVYDPSPPINYRFQIASDQDFSSIVLDKEGLTESEYTLAAEENLAAVEKEAPYYWRVKSTDGASNESQWSSPWSFYVTAPPVPMLLLPINDSETEATAFFDWEDVTSLSPPVTYRLQVASDENFSSIVLEKDGLAGSEYTMTEEEKLAAVKKEVPYYWRVKAVDGAANESEWATPWSFYVGFAFALPAWAMYLLIGIGALLVGFVAFLVGRRTAYYQQQ